MINLEHFRLRYRLKWLEYNDYIFCDISERSFDRVAEYVMEHLYENMIYQALGVWLEPNANDIVKKYLNHLLGNDCSIMVISKDGMQIKGVALMLLTQKHYSSWTNLEMMAGWTGKLKHIVSIRRLIHDDYQETHRLPEFDAMVIHEFIFEKEFLEDRHLMNRMYRSIVQSARHMGATRLTHVVWEQKFQRIPRSQGWTFLSRFIYSIYQEEKERPLDVLRIMGEVAAFLFEIKLKPITPYYERPGYEDRQLKRETLAANKT